MGCLSVVAALLALAVPASIARASLVGAYVVLGLLLATAVVAARWHTQRRRAARGDLGKRGSTAVILGVGVVYAALIAVIHFA